MLYLFYKMKIALVASIWISVPPKGFGFGAQEYLAYYIAERLKKKGHEVTLFASGDSKTSARLHSTTPTQVIDIPFPDPRIKDMFELINLSECYKLASSFDIIHNHLLPYGLVFANTTNTPTVHTLHHSIYKNKADIFLYQRYKNQNYIAISHTQKQIIPELNYVATVYNGIDTTYYTYKQMPNDDYLLYLGRMKHYKGIHTAIAVAKALGKRLIIASPMPTKTQKDYDEVMTYYQSEIEPYLNNTITHLNDIQDQEKINLLQNAKALLSPVEREEPFGMTFIEAMACGTPVIAYDRGAAKEIVAHGKTGFLVNQNPNGIQALQETVTKLYNLPTNEYTTLRANARKQVEDHFTIEHMVDAYEKVYDDILNKQTLKALTDV